MAFKMPRRRLRCEDYSVGWVSALSIELAAVQEILDEEHEDPHYRSPTEDILYTYGRIGEHNVVIACLSAGEIGTNSAAAMATRMKATFTSIKFGLLVGVGGGVPSGNVDIRLGDVVINQPDGQHGGVVQYDFGKLVPGKFSRTGRSLDRPPTILLQAISKLKANHFRGISSLPGLALSSKPMFTRGHSDLLFESDYEHVQGDSCQMCDHQRLVRRAVRQTQDVMVHYGTIASGNCVIRDGRTREKLRDELGNIVCFDMESAGVMNCFPCLVIRGICDYSDSHKNKTWQPYAALTAAATAKELLSVIPAAKVTELPSADDTTAKLALLRSAIDEVAPDEFLRMLLKADSAMEMAGYDLPRDNLECLWAFQNIDFQEWYSGRSPQTLWLSASNSIGLYHIASYTAKDCFNRTSPAGCPGLVIFCSTGINLNLTGIEILNTIFFQLLNALSDTRKMAAIRKFLHTLYKGIVRDKRAAKMELFREDTDISKRVGLILDAPLAEFAATLGVVFGDEVRDACLILDGVDRVNHGHEEFAQAVRVFVDNLTRRAPMIRILLTSQNHTAANEAFVGLPSIERDKERKECLESLQFENTRFDKISKGHKGSFEWIWEHDEYRAWSMSNSSQLLYIQGKPASGKSTLAKYFYNNLDIKHPAANHAIMAKFFYSFREGERQTSHFNMLLTILYDILSQDESFFYHYFQSRYRRRKMALYPPHCQEVGRTSWDYESLKEQLSCLKDYSSARPIYLIIDAVDESDREDRRDILALLYSICADIEMCTVKIFVASRPVEIEPMRGARHHHIVLQNETKADIASFAEGFLEGLQLMHYMKLAVDYIVQNAQGVFLWVELVGAELVALAEGGYAARDIFIFLKELPKELEDLYARMLQRIRRDRSNIRDGLKIFHFVLFAARPLKENELLHALGIPTDWNTGFKLSERAFQDCLPTDLVRRLINCAGNFMEIRASNVNPAFSATPAMSQGSGTVQVIHQTVREFFLDKEGCVEQSDFRITDIAAHQCIAVTCLRYLIFCIDTGPTLDAQGWTDESLRMYASYLQTRPLLCYALEHLGFHLQHLQHDNFTRENVTTLLQDLKTALVSDLLQGWVNKVLYVLPFIETTTEVRNRMLHAAGEQGFQMTVEILLLLGADIDAKDEHGLTPLWKGASNGHAAVVAFLMNKGADKLFHDKRKRTALTQAAINGHDTVVELLIDFVPQVADMDGETPLSYAAANGHENVVRTLIEGPRNSNPQYRVDPMVTNSFMRTPLSQAAENGHQGVVLLLLGLGATLESKDIYGMTPLFRAAYNGHEAMVRLLVEHGASINCKDTYGENPLTWASQNGHEAVVRFLLHSGVPLDDSDDDGRTPLSRAAGNGHLAVVKLLLQNGAMIDSMDVFNRSPLSWAASNGHTEVVRWLLQENAKVNSPASDGRTPLAWAVGNKHDGVIELLRQPRTNRRGGNRNHNQVHRPSTARRGHQEILCSQEVERHSQTRQLDSRSPTITAAPSYSGMNRPSLSRASSATIEGDGFVPFPARERLSGLKYEATDTTLFPGDMLMSDPRAFVPSRKKRGYSPSGKPSPPAKRPRIKERELAPFPNQIVDSMEVEQIDCLYCATTCSCERVYLA